MKHLKNTLIVIAGPTASGKSDLAIALAQKYNGEIISADSRQVYCGMDIGTGKVIRDTPEISKYQLSNQNSLYFSGGIRHHLLDVADPRIEYNISHFLVDAETAIVDITTRGKLPILCGGTHFWIQALVDGTNLPSVPPDSALRTILAPKSTEELFSMLHEKDPLRAETIDRHNRLRLIRALEICAALGTVPPLSGNQKSKITNHKPLILVLNPETDVLKKNIAERLEKRFAEGMIDEIRHLHTNGLSWERLESFGLEYRSIARFLQGFITEPDMKTELSAASWQYARRQLTWLRRWEKKGASLHRITTLTEAENLLNNTR